MGQQQPKEFSLPKGPCVYILELEHGKYYVGKTNNLQKRLLDHEMGGDRASEWTKLHKYKRLVTCTTMTSDFDEDKITKEAMYKYGIDNVRGGKYVRVTLSPEEIKVIQDEISHAKGECFVCKKTGHISKYCPKNQKNGQDVPKTTAKKNGLYCERCHRNTHVEAQCSAFTTFEKAKLCRGTTKAGAKCKKTIEEQYDYCIYHKPK